MSAVLAWHLDWEAKGLEILGPTEVSSGGLFAFNWPFQLANMKHVRTALSKAFIIALLGFFESSVAAKGLGEGSSAGIKGMHMSANREMVALGVANVIGGCFSALPAFGGYGRSKLSSQTGARSPMTSVFVSIITFTCVLVLLPYLYYLPVRPSPAYTRPIWLFPCADHANSQIESSSVLHDLRGSLHSS